MSIPVRELPMRQAELSAPGDPLRVAAVHGAEEALAWLRRGGREAEASDEFTYGVSQPGRLWEPNPFLMRVAAGLTPGEALDLGCGQGREVVALAQMGWRVSAVDHLPGAIERGQALARRYAPDHLGNIEWVVAGACCYLEEAHGPYDLAISFFCFSPNWVRPLAGLVRPGGDVLIQALSLEHRRRHGRPTASRVTSAEQLSRLLGACDVQVCEETESAKGHVVQAWARARVLA